MRLDYTDPASLKDIIEALIFASDEPLSASDIRSLILDEPIKRVIPAEAGSEAASDMFNPPAEEEKKSKKQLLDLTVIREATDLVNAELEETGRPYRVVEIAGGFQFATMPTLSMYVSRLYKERSRRRLSNAALETLAIIAYKQPVSKADVENIRGVNCDEVLKSLLEKNLVTITGRAETVGRPLLYGTTDEFLRQFGLASMRDLPKPREIEEMLKEESVKATTLDEAASEYVDSDADKEEVTIDEIIAVSKEEAASEAPEAEAFIAEEEADTIEAEA
ncbi:MAG TPA: SMC-Scp complex subunit ScpB [Candidatus Kapabacteria bacterium]|nr:SMC-Scp complex subunit ScpB [Candidatus Kapabacteria bacterium]